ncbi:MAG: hypothetical protein WA177_00280 [Xanthobacteraceae bacterium]
MVRLEESGGVMLRLMQRLAIGLFAAGIFSFGGGSAWAFSQQTVGPGGAGNYTFADPDEHLIDPDNQNSGQDVRPFGANGPVVQFGIQQNPLSYPFGRSDNTSTPDPYYQPLHFGN